MDRLAAAQNLPTNQELVSNNGLSRLKMFPNGQLGIYRTQTNLAIWGNLMQADGNCVALSAQHVPY